MLKNFMQCMAKKKSAEPFEGLVRLSILSVSCTLLVLILLHFSSSFTFSSSISGSSISGSSLSGSGLSFSSLSGSD